MAGAESCPRRASKIALLVLTVYPGTRRSVQSGFRRGAVDRASQ